MIPPTDVERAGYIVRSLFWQEVEAVLLACLDTDDPRTDVEVVELADAAYRIASRYHELARQAHAWVELH